MLKTNKRLAALATAVLILALTVFGSLTVSAEDSTDTVTPVTFEFIPQNSQLTVKVTAWDTTCTGLYFTVDGVAVGDNFKVDIVGPVLYYVGTLAYCSALTTGAHTIGVTQTTSSGTSYAAALTKEYYFTSTSSSYTLDGYPTLVDTPNDFKNLTYVSTSTLGSFSYIPCTYNGVNYLIGLGAYKYYIYKIDDNGGLSVCKENYTYYYKDSTSDYKVIYQGGYGTGGFNHVYCDGDYIYLSCFVGNYNSKAQRNYYASTTTFRCTLQSFFSRGSALFSYTGGYNMSLSTCFSEFSSVSSSYYNYFSTIYNGYLYEFFQTASGGDFSLKIKNLADNTFVTHSSFLPSSMYPFYNFQQIGRFCYWTCNSNGTSDGVFIAELDLSDLTVKYTRIDGVVSSHTVSMFAEGNNSFIFFSTVPVKLNLATNTYYTGTSYGDSYNISARSYSVDSIRFGSYIIAAQYKIQYTNYLPPKLYSEAEYQAIVGITKVDKDGDGYDDASFTAGKQAGITYQKNVTTDSGVADFVTKILGAFTGSALYVGSNISIGGITLLTIVGIIAIGGAVIIVLKVLKGG